MDARPFKFFFFFEYCIPRPVEPLAAVKAGEESLKTGVHIHAKHTARRVLNSSLWSIGPENIPTPLTD